MNDMIEFRTAFRGYSKEDVNRYIEEVNRRFADAEKELKQEIQSLTASNEALSTSLSEKEQALTDLAEESRLLREKLTAEEEAFRNHIASENDAIILALNETIDTLKKENEELKSGLLAAQSEQEMLAKAVTSTEIDREKANMYDKVSSQIGMLMVNANATKEAIIADAIEKAKNESAELKSKEAAILNRAMSEVTNSIAAEIAGIMSDVSKLDDRLNAFMKETESRIRAKCEETVDRIRKENADFSSPQK
ncbi:MAG: hypothetical protein E7655_02440 [Ruminococcaceae bacterium]|nr:hypothetical protein [Oscillospiraceae bacterium]